VVEFRNMFTWVNIGFCLCRSLKFKKTVKSLVSFLRFWDLRLQKLLVKVGEIDPCSVLHMVEKYFVRFCNKVFFPAFWENSVLFRTFSPNSVIFICGAQMSKRLNLIWQIECKISFKFRVCDKFNLNFENKLNFVGNTKNRTWQKKPQVFITL